MKKIVILLLTNYFAYSQFHSPTINANLGTNEYGTSNYVSGSSTWYLTWNETDLFVYLQNANQSEPVSIYLDVDPVVPVNGGNHTNGTLVGLNYDSYSTRPNLPFRADVIIYCHNGYREIFRRDGNNGWLSLGGGADGICGDGTNDYTGNSNGQYSSNDNGNEDPSDDRREFRISWNRLLGSINSGNRPSSFNWLGYVSYNNGMYAQVPLENYSGSNVTGNSNGIVRYFTVSSTSDGSSTGPFDRNSFTQPITATNNSFGAISVWDFTMNSNGQQIARTSFGGDWNIGGTLTVGGGTLYFGSGGSSYGSTNVGNLYVTGNGVLDMDQTNKKLNVLGNVTNLGTLKLSNTIGGDLSVAGNLIDNGVFNSNSRAVFFTGTGIQDISGDGLFSVDYMVLNKTSGTVRLLNDLLCEGPNGGNAITLTNSTDILDLNGNTLTLGKANVNSVITGSGYIRGSSSSNISILGSENLGTILFDQSIPGTSNVLNNFSFNRTSGSVTIGNSLIISGNFEVFQGTIVTPFLISFNGSSSQNLAGLDYNNIEFSGAGVKTFTSSASVSSNSVITFSGTPGTIDFDGLSDDLTFLLKSDDSGTARIGNATGWILNGKVTAERYIPAKRGWRLLTAPLKGNANTTIPANWQGVNDEGLLLFSPSTYQSQTMTGYTTGGGMPNIWKYDSANSQWQSIPDLTNENLFTSTGNNGYLVFATGPSNSTNIASGAAETTLRPEGQLITGNVSHSLTANQYHLIGNPYASALNTEALVQANANTKVFMVDPSIATVGGYVTYDGTNWAPTAPSGSDKYIQSGQGFFVRSSSNTTFAITESHKVMGNSNTWFSRTSSSSNASSNASSNVDADKIRVLLYKQINGQWQLADGILTVNSATANNDVDATDTEKMSNFNENIGFRNGTSTLAIEYRGLPTIGTVQPMRLTGTTVQPYQMRVTTENYSNSDLQPYLEDMQTGVLTLIPTDGSEVVVNFTGIVATTSAPDSRFRIVYPVTLSSDDPTASLSVGIYPNPVEDKIFTIVLPNQEETARYTLTNLLGQQVQGGELDRLQNAVSVASLQGGVYVVQVVQSGKTFTKKLIIK